MSDEYGTADIEVRKRVDAPIDEVFTAFTDGDQIAGWWGPEGFSATATSDARPGGALRIVMVGPEGVDQPIVGSYTEVTPPSRIVTDMIAEWPAGVDAVHAVIEVELTEVDGGTEIRVRAQGRGLAPQARPMLEGMEAGWTETLQCLDRYLRERRQPSLKMRHETA
jgi:uncharacterized protein YndB with AHSA1/START domain